MKMEHTAVPLLIPPRVLDPQFDESDDGCAPAENASIATRLTPPIHKALALLLDAATCANDVGADLWQFSLELSALLRAGLTANECRWLVAKGLAKHACETTTPDLDRRVFQPCANLALPKRTCLVLTERGMDCANQILRSEAKRNPAEERRTVASALIDRPLSGNPVSGNRVSENIDTHSVVPTWDSDRQQLRVGRVIVKEFKVPAANQEAILAAFQEENWCPRIDDPLAPKLNQDSKRRLHDTINSLNRNQRHPLLRFLGDGKGEGVRWELQGRGPGPGAVTT